LHAVLRFYLSIYRNKMFISFSSLHCRKSAKKYVKNNLDEVFFFCWLSHFTKSTPAKNVHSPARNFFK
jgi:hypothetical protein